MNQVRFQIGVPKAGSAARTAENGEDTPLRSMRPRAGSAARDAEERKRAEPVAGPSSAAIGLRARGGRKVTAEEMRAASMGRPLSTAVTPVAQAADSPALSVSNVNAHDALHPLPSGTPADGTVEENVSSGPLQVAAARIKSLVQSLSFFGVSSSKS